MDEKDLKRLSRQDLLKLLLEVEKENQRLSEALEAAHAQLNDRRIRISEAGNIAQAALSLNGIFEAAQRAADDYVSSVKALNEKKEEESKKRVTTRQERSWRTLEEKDNRDWRKELTKRARREGEASGDAAGMDCRLRSDYASRDARSSQSIESLT